jgi:hypothetical protein
MNPGTPTPVGTAIDHVTLRRLFYYNSDYTRAYERYATFDAPADSYQTYLHSLAVALDEDVEHYGEVLLFPLRVDDFETWAASCALAADSPRTREEYLASIPTEEFHHISDPEVLFALITINIMSTLGSAMLHEMLVGMSEEEARGVTELVLDNAALAFDQITEFLEAAIVSTAIITYKALGFYNGKPAEVTGDLDLFLRAGSLHARSPEHMTVLSSIMPLGVQQSAFLTVRCFLNETDPRTGFPLKMLYGWHLSPDGLSGMSAAELFDVACTEPDGSPRPPEEGVTYAGTDTLYT